MFPAPIRPIFFRVGMAIWNPFAAGAPLLAAFAQAVGALRSIHEAVRSPGWGARGELRLRLPSNSNHVLDHVVSELGALDLGPAVHQPREVVGHALAANGPVHAFDDEIGRSEER